jgi:transposase-like protein
MALHIARSEATFTPGIRPVCPRCGDTLYASVNAAFLGRGQIFHTWRCETCDHEFNTAVVIPEDGDDGNE